MAKKIEAKYEADDGSEWPSEKEAELHNCELKAITLFNQVKESFEATMLAKLKTADGVSFDVTAWKDYYYVRRGYQQMPSVFTVAFGRSSNWRLDGHRNGELHVTIPVQGRNNQVGERDTLMTFEVSELYYNRCFAEQRRLEMLREFLVEVQEEIEATVKRIGEK